MANAFARLLTTVTGRGLSGTAKVSKGSYRGYETPAYDVERTVGAAEIRAYAPHLLALVTVGGDRDKALSAGFRVLAGYIFGGNTGAAKVAMTSPVAQTPAAKIAMTSPVGQVAQGGEWVVSFMMPAEYTPDTLPTPKSGDIRFEQTAPERQIVLGFTGRATPKLIAQKEAELRGIMAAEGLTAKGSSRTYFYDDPFTLPWNRRNEVAFVLA